MTQPVSNYSSNFTIDSTNITVSNGTVTVELAPNNLTVCIIGLRNTQTEGLFTGNFSYAGRNFSYHPEFYHGYSDLPECNLLVYKSDELGKSVGRMQREYAVKAVSDGVSLLFSQKAFWATSEDPSVDGWSFVIGGILPVQTTVVGHERIDPTETEFTGELRFKTIQGWTEGRSDLGVHSLPIINVLPSDGASIVADFATGPTSESYLAISSKQNSPFAGAVVFYSFDAFNSESESVRSLVKDAAEHLLQDFLRKRLIV